MPLGQVRFMIRVPHAKRSYGYFPKGGHLMECPERLGGAVDPSVLRMGSKLFSATYWSLSFARLPLWFLLECSMNDLRTFLYFNDYTLNYHLRNQVPSKGQVLPAEWPSIPGLPRPQVMARANLSGWRVASGREQECRAELRINCRNRRNARCEFLCAN